MEALHTEDPIYTVYDSWSNAYKNLKLFIEDYNARISEPGYMRQPNEKPIRLAAARTAEAMLRLYLGQLSKLNQMSQLAVSELPPFQTSNAGLAVTQGVSCKTIYNHRLILKAAGFIQAEENFGANGFELKLNPSLFLKPEARQMWISKNVVDKPEIGPENQPAAASENPISAYISALKNDSRKYLPPLGLDQQDQEKKIGVLISGVHEHSLPEPTPTATASAEQDQSKTTQKGEAALDTAQEKFAAAQPESAPKNEEVGGAAAAAQAEAGNITDSRQKWEAKHRGGIKPPNPEEQNRLWKGFVMDLCQRFWQEARGLLYSHRKFTEQEEKVALNLIWRVLFFRGVRDAHNYNRYRQHAQNLHQRLQMAANYAASHPEFSILPADLYFSDRDMKGTFAATEKWLVNAQRNQEWRKLCKEAERLRKGKLKLRFDGKLRQPSGTELFRRQLQRLERLGDEALLQRFTQYVAATPQFYKRAAHA